MVGHTGDISGCVPADHIPELAAWQKPSPLTRLGRVVPRRLYTSLLSVLLIHWCWRHLCRLSLPSRWVNRSGCAAQSTVFQAHSPLRTSQPDYALDNTSAFAVLARAGTRISRPRLFQDHLSCAVCGMLCGAIRRRTARTERCRVPGAVVSRNPQRNNTQIFVHSTVQAQKSRFKTTPKLAEKLSERSGTLLCFCLGIK